MTELILILSVLAGGILGYFFYRNKTISSVLLTFSGAFLLTATILEIFPKIFEHGNPNIGLFVLLGVFVQIILEAITKGAEHGHFHYHKENAFPYSIFIGLVIHAFLEGIPIHQDHHNHLLYTIVIHKIPVAMVLFGFIQKITSNLFYRILFMLVFALSSPLGYWFGFKVPEETSIYLLALVSGIFLHISTVIIFESSDGHHLKFRKLLAMLIGFTLAFFSL